MITANTLEHMDRISAEAEARGAEKEVARETAPPVATCSWNEDAGGFWETSCGEAFVFTADGPVENGMRFCPYCGRSLEVKAS